MRKFRLAARLSAAQVILVITIWQNPFINAIMDKYLFITADD